MLVFDVALIQHWIVELLGLQQLHLLQDKTSMIHGDVSMYPQSLLFLPCGTLELARQYLHLNYSSISKKKTFVNSE